MGSIVVQELISKLGFDVDRTSLAAADTAMQNFQGLSLGMSTAIFAAGAAAAAVFAGIATQAVQAAMQLETVTASFETMLGNSGAAKALVGEVRAMAAATPFETAGLLQNVQTGMQFGQSASDSLASVKMLGDIAGTSQEKLNQLSYAWAQISATGRLQGQDLMQLINAGFNPLLTISQKTGESLGALKKKMEQGGISSEMVRDAFKTATSEGGRFYKGMEKQSQTLTGLISTLKDNFGMISTELGTRMMPYIKAVITEVLKLTDGIGDAYRNLAMVFGVFLQDGPQALTIANGIGSAFLMVADALKRALLVWMQLKMSLLGLQLLGQTILNFFYMIGTGIIQALLAVVQAFVQIVSGAFDTLIPEKFQTALGINFDPDAVAEFFDGMKNGVSGFWEHNKGVAQYYSDKIVDNQVEQDWVRGQLGKTSKAFAKGKMDADTLAALAGGAKSITQNNYTDIRVHADGDAKDGLREAARSLFGINLQERLLVAAS